MEEQWDKLYPQDHQPTLGQIAEYIGGQARALWDSLLSYMEAAYKARPKLTYSVCAGQPGWNVKFAKSGQSLGTFYPERNGFTAFVVVGYKHAEVMEAILPDLTPVTAEMYRQAGDFMRIGRWMMLPIRDAATLEDLIKLAAVKLPPKVKVDHMPA